MNFCRMRLVVVIQTYFQSLNYVSDLIQHSDLHEQLLTIAVLYELSDLF